jgi:hypothetical protein
VPGKTPARLALSNVFMSTLDVTSGQLLRYYNGNPLYRRYGPMRWAPQNFDFGYKADILTQLLDRKASYVEIAVVGMHFSKSGRSSVMNRDLISVAPGPAKIALRRSLYWQ